MCVTGACEPCHGSQSCIDIDGSEYEEDSEHAKLMAGLFGCTDIRELHNTTLEEL